MADDQGPTKTESRELAVRQERTPVADIVPLFDSSRFEHYGRIAAVMAGAKLVPDALRGSPSDCYLVVEQADRWGMSPFAVAQCCSVVGGKLMYEGKLVAAVIREKTGIEFDYHFTGERGKDDRRVYISDVPFTDEVVAQLTPGGRYRGWRIIDGSIGEWKTKTKDGSINFNWVNPQQADMQLSYRSARVWSRLYEPSIMLGVYTDDEMGELEHRQEVAEDRRARRGKADLTGKLAAQAPTPEPGKEQGFTGDHVARETTTAKDTAKSEPETVETIVEGPAPADTPYFLAGDTFGPDGRRAVYQDGARLQNDSAADDRIAIYAEHAERPTKAGPGETTAQTADVPREAEAATPASDAGTATDDGSTATGGDTSATEPDDITRFILSAPRAQHWVDVKRALAELMKTATWAEAEPHEQRGARISAWESPARTRDKVDPGQDPTAFRCWVEVADDPDAVTGTLELLGRSEGRKRVSDETWAKLADAAGTIIAKLKAPA